MRYAYYPGCSLTHSAEPYDLSTKAIAAPLGLSLEEIDDWNCCGATEYISINKNAAYALVRNLAWRPTRVSTTWSPQLRVTSICASRPLHGKPRTARQDQCRSGAGDLHYDPGTTRRHLLMWSSKTSAEALKTARR
jgi:heterodisulfide reductase subunit B